MFFLPNLNVSSMRAAGTHRNFDCLPIFILFMTCWALTSQHSILAEEFKNFDGPAELPRLYVKSSVGDTPAPGHVLRVRDGEGLQDGLRRAACGDTTDLQAGVTYSGYFELPAKSCDDGHWIVIQTGSPDSSLPPEGTRITPCYAGVSSLPGRPPFHCNSTTNVMARIGGMKGQNKVIGNSPGANHYRFLGLEIADTGANGDAGGYYDLVLLKNADHIIFDRCWIHGTPIGEDIKGIDFEHSSHIAVVDSYISDIHSKTSVFGADSSAIGSVTGIGPVKVVNNFLEAAGASILWGGGRSDTTLADIEFRHNHVFKPLTWWEKSSSYFGTRFAVKNLYETKNSIRELIEGNIFENNWAQSQKGTAILLYPKNQGGHCPGCIVHDLTFRYNIVRHTANGISMAATRATTCVGESGNGTGHCNFLSGPIYNVYVHDNVLEDVSESTYEGSCCTGGVLWTIGADQPENLPHDITIEHNTGFPAGSGIFYVVNTPPRVINNFVFRNNLVGSGDYGFRGVPIGGGNKGCAGPDGALGALERCFSNSWAFTSNVIVYDSRKPTPTGDPYPKSPHCGALKSCSQFFPKNWKAVGFVNFNDGNGGNYHLLPSSPYHNAGTDGKDIGANMDALDAALAGVVP
jgi:hypothetical protein